MMQILGAKEKEAWEKENPGASPSERSAFLNALADQLYASQSEPLNNQIDVPESSPYYLEVVRQLKEKEAQKKEDFKRMFLGEKI